MKLQAQIIKQLAYKQGFALCGIAKAEPLFIEKERFEKALAQNFHAKKAYFERDIERRFHPELLIENCKSVVVCGFNYNMQKSRKAEEQKSRKYLEPLTLSSGMRHAVSQYAQIKDYHVFMKEKLEALAQNLHEKYGIFNYKTTVDSSTISEKAWAVKSGIGYYGKNGVIQTQFGSFVFLGCLLIDKELDTYDTPNQKTCGNCNTCMERCPTNAIVAPYYVDCNRCISNINLNKNETDFSDIAKYGWLVGCDECQNVYPNNAKAPVNEDAMKLRASFVENQNEILENLTPETFEKYFKDTAIYKLGFEGLRRRCEVRGLGCGDTVY